MFSLLRGLLKGLEMIWKWHIYENSYIYIYIYMIIVNYTILLDHKCVLLTC